MYKRQPWSVFSVLAQAGHGDGWDGRTDSPDENYWGPTYDEDGGGEGVHPAERGGRAGERRACDERRAFATMMAKSKENVSEILKAVPFDKALMIQNELDKYVRFLFANPDADKLKNPAQVPKQGRPKGQASSCLLYTSPSPRD